MYYSIRNSIMMRMDMHMQGYSNLPYKAMTISYFYSLRFYYFMRVLFFYFRGFQQ